MRKVLLLTGLLYCALMSFAQVNPQERALAMSLVESNKTAIGISSADLNQIIVHTAYQIPSSDIRMVYLQQGYKGIPIFNQVQVLAFRNGKLVSNAGGMLPNLEARTQNNPGIPTVAVTDAIITALRHERIETSGITVPLTKTIVNGKKYEFAKTGTKEPITAELLWLPIDGGKDIKLVWQVFVAPQKTSDYWLLRVDAATNVVIDQQNLTVYCNWDGEKHSVQEHFQKKHFKEENRANYVLQQDKKTMEWQFRPFVVNNTTYRVIKYPAESPQHPNGAPAIHNNPWTWAPGPATALGWHYDNSVYHDSTRGNNVWAYEDRNANNLPEATSTAESTTPQPNLSFDFVPDLTQEPVVTSPTPNQQFNITNLFYWNNLMHDVLYVYGFTETARNFQAYNQGLGGLGNDFVLAEAQDGVGTNNANFASNADGTNGRMQMFLWPTPTPDRDGDVDNGIIAHEYSHGISNRMTGTGVGCLGGQEQMGEGWSDFYSLMVTNTTNMAINPFTYGNLPAVVAPHGVGSVWCTMLWDMTWEIINMPGVGINPNLFQVSPTITGGNNIAMKLVTEGLRLQPCNPGFVDGRNAILRADTLFFGGQYSCAIMRAFARRGVGVGASQGTSASKTDQVLSFVDGGSGLLMTQTAPTVSELQNITYTNKVEALCSNFTGYTLIDTLPTSVTYVSGGTYNAANRTVTFTPVNVNVGAPQSFSFTVNVNAGTYFPPVDFINDPVLSAPPAVPATWTSTSVAPGNVWVSTATQSHTAPNAYFTPNAVTAEQQILRLTNPVVLNNFSTSYPTLSFWHSYNTEAGWDGGVVEISTDNLLWTDLGPRIVTGKYNAVLGAGVGNPIANRNAFTGNSGGFIKTEIDLTPWKGQSVYIRFRFGSDDNTGAPSGVGGWWVDDILLRAEAVIPMRSSLFNASMSRVQVKDTISYILPSACTNPSISTQPASVVRCAGTGSSSFSVVAAGTAVTYQWQVSTNNGAVWGNIPSATNSTYDIAAPTTALNGNLYRVIVTGLCGSPVTSDAASFYMSPAMTHTAVSATPPATCAPGTTAITGTANGGTVANTVIASSGIVNLAIPDGVPAGINSRLTLPALTIPQASNLKIRLGLAHVWSGDLKVTLTSPCGITFVFDQLGVPADPFGNGDNFGTDGSANPPPATYLFDLSGATVLPEGTGGGTGFIAAGTYQPSNTPGASHNWNGLTFPCGTAGVWTLNVSDAAASDVGTLRDWAILLGGNYTHTLTGTGTIAQNAPTGTNNSTGNFGVTAIPAGAQTYTLVSTDILGCSVTSTVNVTVNNPITITTQPVDRTICTDKTTTLTVADNSALPPTYQWFYNTGSGFIAVPNVPPYSNSNTATLTITAPPVSHSGYTFYAAVTNGCGTVNSNTVTLTVNPLPTITVGPSNQCAPVTLTAAGNSNTYAWAPATGLSATTGASVTASPTVSTTYTVTGTITATGCQNTAATTVFGTPSTPVVSPANPNVCAGTPVSLTVPLSSATFTYSGGSITVPGTGTGATTGAPASVYPANITVAGLPTSGVVVQSVTINGITHSFPGDIDMLVQSPTGTNVILMSDAGGDPDLSSINYTFSDAGSLMSATVLNPSGTYRPTNSNAGADQFPAPGPGGVTQLTPTLSSFGGDPNGQWKLFVVDDAATDAGSITSWSITFGVPTARWTPVTGLYTDAAGTIPYVAGTFLNTVYANPALTTTYTVTNTLGACSAPTPGTVTVTVSPAPTVSVSPNNQCGPVTLTATGTANTYSWSPAAGLSATTGATVVANPTVNTTYTVTGTITATGCTASTTVNVNFTPLAPAITPANATICVGTVIPLNAVPINTFSSSGTITIPGTGTGATTGAPANPYPSTINIAGLPATGVTVQSVTINGVTHTFPDDMDILLQSPTGTNVVLMSDAGFNGVITNNTYTFNDAGPLMLDNALNPSGTYRPSNFEAAADQFPAPGPGAITQPTPTLASFTGNPNGQWKLFIVDDANLDAGSMTTWSITFNVAGVNWSPATGLYTNAAATTPYVAGTLAPIVYAKPTTTTTYAATVATATCTSPATNVTVTVLQPAAITTAPTAQTVCAGVTANFSVVATGTNITYQWQVNTGSGFVNVPAGSNTASLVVANTTTAMNGYQYRVIVQNGCSTVISAAATLTVNAVPVVTAAPLTQRICLSDTLVALSGTPAGGVWTGVGVSGNTFIPVNTSVGTYTLTYTFTSAAGCPASATTTAKVESCPERMILLRDDAVILWPNPNNGQFNIRINSTLYNFLGMDVYNIQGQLLNKQFFTGLRFNRVIPIDLKHLPGGVYMVKFTYDAGNLTAEKTFKVVIAR
jgi:subtilisin-like proprotein convertase family protein